MGFRNLEKPDKGEWLAEGRCGKGWHRSEVAYLGTVILVMIPPPMDRHISYWLLFAVLLHGSLALAQDGSGPQIVPNTTGSMSPPVATPPSPGPSPSSQTGLFTTPTPSGLTSPPPDQTSWPPSAQPVSQPTTPNVPPVQPSYVLAPDQPVYQPLAPWLPNPSPGLGLVPGASNPRWDYDVDALWLVRDTGGGVGLGFTDSDVSHHFRTVRTDRLWSDDVLFPMEPGIRFQLIGRITDQMAVEATCWGLQDWSVGRTIYGDQAGGHVLAHSSWLQTPDFDNSLGYTYSSQVANVELNQRFKLYTFDPYRAFSWLWGVRYFHLSDDFTVSGSDLYTGTNETLNWQAKNNLIGMQLGLQWDWGWDRFQLSTGAKIGLFANIYSQQGTDSASGTAAFQSFDVSHGSTDLAALFEFSVLLRYRITSCMWLRAGYQYCGVGGLALGPRQLDGYDTSGGVELDGLSLGLELTR